MTFNTLVCLAACVGGGHVIDSFDYSDSAAARRVWTDRADGGSSSQVEAVEDDGRWVIEFAAPFATQPKLGRVYIDRKVELNLAGAGAFQLDVLVTAPESAGHVSLYFHSQSGWYAAGGGLAGEGWQTLTFSKAAFSVEERPVGWHKIDAVRIAVWRGQPKDFKIRLRRLEAVEHDVALVIPSASSHGEYRSALKSAEEVGEMLAELGLGSDAVEDRALAEGALGKRCVAILAYNPSMPGASVDALVQFVERGGKVLACYQLPRPLGTALGFAEPKYVGGGRSGQFAEVRFHADIDGLPPAMRQASWNITAAKPSGHNARIIAHWYDDKGKPIDQPAMLLSDRGAFFSHIILNDDRANKKQMLAGILGHLAPRLWRQMAETALQRAGLVGHLGDDKALMEFLRSAERAEVKDQLDAGNRELADARGKFERQAYADAVRLAASAHAALVKAYLLAQPSAAVESRAFWNHSGTGAYDGDWDRTARELTAAGFNMILPNMLWGGRAHYASDVLPRSSTFEQYGDQIAQCVEAAKKVGLEVHVWKVNFNLSGAPKEFVEMIRQQKRNQVAVDGTDHDWLCPSHPENFQLELASMLEVATKYDVDGLHFDYIRYPDRDKCYCSGCRERFQAQTGNQVANWPKDCYSGPLREPYAQWRCDQITRLVKAVHDEAKKLRPEIKISAAVFGAYPNCRESVAQDWPEWVKAGYLDFVCPMDYTQSDLNFIGLVSDQLRLVDGRIPVYPGIGQWRLSDDRTVGQIYHARRLGTRGFTVFDLSPSSIHSAVPAIGIGVGKQPAVPAHRK